MFTIYIALLVFLNALVSGNPVTRLRRHDQRFVSTLREAAHQTSCPYSFHLDINENRLPRVIEKVKCYSVGRHCPLTESKSSCCSEILTQISVHYINSGVSRNETYPVGCICLNWPSARANTIVPDIMV